MRRADSKKKAERVLESLRGTWAEEHLFALRQAVEDWPHFQRQMAACDRQIEAVLRQISGPEETTPRPPAPTSVAKRAGVNAPQIEGWHGLLVELCGGQDLTVLPAHWVERTFEEAKGAVGLTDYQVRGWRGWQHHAALVMMAMLLLLEER